MLPRCKGNVLVQVDEAKFGRMPLTVAMQGEDVAGQCAALSSYIR